MNAQLQTRIAALQDRIHFFGLLAVAASLPLPYYALSNISMITVAVNALVAWLLGRRIKGRGNILVAALPAVLFLLYLIGVTYSSHTSDAWSSIERKVPLLLLPTALALFPKLERPQMNRILLGFLVSCVAISVLCVVAMMRRNIAAGIEFAYYNNYYFVQDNLVEGFNIHHVYFSMYICFCVVICLYFLQQFKNSAVRIALFITIIWSILFMFGLSARMGLVALTIIAALYFIFLIRFRWPIKVLVGAAALATFIFVGYQFPFVREKFTGLMGINVNDYSSRYRANVRMVSIQTTWDIFRKNWMLGVGTGDLNDLLIEEYKRINFEEGLVHQYNPHNQYVDTAASIGILGALVLVGMMGLYYFLAIRSRDFVLLAFAMIVSFCFLTESMLARQRGVVFFTLFSSLLFVHGRSEDEPIMKF